MAVPVHYKSPRRINVVSVCMAVIVAMLAYLAYEVVPIFFRKQEAFRVLEETGSTWAGRRRIYRDDAKATQALHGVMIGNLRGIGIYDPELETWIEYEGVTAHFGAIYSDWIAWPFDAFAPLAWEQRVEHELTIP